MISVLVPFYNRKEYLRDALESIAAQTFKNWQVLLYDDGSTDGSHIIAEDFLLQYPGFMQRSKQNKGVGHARNQLLEMINTPYACWIDSDDKSYPERLEKQLEAIQQCDMVFSFMKFLTDTPIKSTFKIDISKYTSRAGLYNNTTFATAFFRKELAQYKFKELRRKEDVAWLSDLIVAGVKFGCVEEPLYLCRRHENRLTKMSTI
jgi:teichuronic acid biosynthesis glycosyltransferase TuaG